MLCWLRATGVSYFNTLPLSRLTYFVAFCFQGKTSAFSLSPDPRVLGRGVLPGPRWINLVCSGPYWALALSPSAFLLFDQLPQLLKCELLLMQSPWQKKEVTYPEPESLTTLSQTVLKPCQGSQSSTQSCSFLPCLPLHILQLSFCLLSWCSMDPLFSSV